MADGPNPKSHRGFLRKVLLSIAATVVILGGGLLAYGLFIPAKAVVAQVLLNKAWAETLETGAPAKPWPWADTWPTAHIEVPRLNKAAVVLAGATGEAMAFGPGHQHGTPSPGERGTAILGGHRDTHFRFLKDVQPGDDVRVTDATGAVHRYRVTHMSIRHWQNSGIDPYRRGRHLALVTCYPFDSLGRGPLRYVVHAEHVEDRPSPFLKDERAGAPPSLTVQPSALALLSPAE